MTEKRLIDANALLDAMRDEEFQTFVPLDEIDSVIDKAPTIDAVDVVRCKDCRLRHSSELCECRPDDAFCSDGEAMSDHGHWIEYEHACGYYMQGYICSECHAGNFDRLAECPKCHAKMDGKEG